LYVILKRHTCFRRRKAGGLTEANRLLLSQHQNYSLENVHITTTTPIKFAQKYVY
jgi:hypothetical protein